MNVLKALAITLVTVGGTVGVILLSPFIMLIFLVLFIFFAVHYELTNNDEDDY